jgi:hypothetical protein
MHLIHFTLDLTVAADEFQSAVLLAIPQAIDLLMDAEPQVQQVALKTLEKLGQEGMYYCYYISSNL